MNVLRAYDAALTKYPILTKCVTSFILFGLGDVMSQKFEGVEQLDMVRTARMATWGVCFTPLAHGWFAILEKVPGKGTGALVKKVLLDQLTWTPFINSLFFATTSFMQHRDADLAVQSVQDKLWPTLKVNWVVWPVLQGINLALVPLPYRILFVNVASLFWSAFLSNMASAKPAGEAVVVTQAALPPSSPSAGGSSQLK